MTNRDLDALIKKYQRSPEFIGVDLRDPNQPGMTGDTLLHAAVVRGELVDIDVLIASGALVNVKGDLGNTPLHYAASRGSAEVVQRLLQHGADARSVDEFGQTPLQIAKLKSHMQVIRILEDHLAGK